MPFSYRQPSALKPGQFEALQSLREKVAARETPSSAEPVEYPPEVRTVSERINYNAQILGQHYGRLLPGRGLENAFAGALKHVAQRLSQTSQRFSEPLYADALAELRLLTEADRLLVSGDFEHLRISPQIDQDGESYLVKANLQGVYFKEGVPAHFAVWRFEPAGIRLEVNYYEPGSSREVSVQARMDFHYRGQPGQESETKQAALDLEGKYLSPALRELKMDYHRSREFAGVIRTNEEFAALRQARFDQIQRLTQKHSG